MSSRDCGALRARVVFVSLAAGLGAALASAAAQSAVCAGAAASSSSLSSAVSAAASASAAWVQDKAGEGGGAKAEFPDTHVGRMARAYVEAFNSGDEQRMRAFESAYRSKESLGRRSLVDRIKQWRELREDWGRLEVVRIAGDERPMVIVHATRSDEHLKLDFMLEDGEPHGLDGIRIESTTRESAMEAGRGLDEATRREAVEQIARALDRVYVFPDVGRRMAELVRQRAAEGAYDRHDGAETFARAVMEDLRTVCGDKHLGLRVGVPPRPGAGGEPGRALVTRIAGDNYGFQKVEILPGNIGYVKFNAFVPGPEAQEAAAAAMNFVAGADALIIDLRANGGGSPEMIAFLSGYLLDEKVHLNSFYNREQDSTQESYSRTDVPGRRFGGKRPVYVLTSGRTFSGAEEFAYNLKNLKRATIVGETTGGGAHPVRGVEIAGRFTLMVPFARAINPITKTNWEGTGVDPDVKVSAEEALEEALRRIRGETE